MGDMNINLTGMTPKVSVSSGKKETEDINFKDICTLSKSDLERPSADIHVHRAKLMKKTFESGNKEKLKFKLDDISEFLSGEKKLDLQFDFGSIFDSLTGAKEFNETLSNTDINQTKFQEDLISTLGSGARIQNQQDVSKLNGRIPTIAELNDEFQKLASDKSIPFEYIVDGCYARAHLMCEQMMKDGINCGKMFTMVENPFSGDTLTASNKFMNAEWWYHVAPLVFAENPETKKVEGYVMDPSMANRPLKAEEWVNMMWDKKINIKIDITRAPQFGPLESDGENKTFEESIPPSQDTVKEYSRVLKDIKDKYYAEHPDEKPPDWV